MEFIKIMADIKELTLGQIYSTFENIKSETVKIRTTKDKIKYLLSILEGNKEIYEQENISKRPIILPTKVDSEFKDNTNATIVVNGLTLYVKDQHLSYNKDSECGKLLDEIITYYKNEESNI